MNHASEKDEGRALIYSGNADTASGRGGYGGVSTEDNGNPPDLASTFYHQSSIFHTMRKGSIVGHHRNLSEIMRGTRRHRLYLAFFLFATSAFVLVAMLSRGGWTLGRIITTSVMMPRVVTCPPALADWEPNAECKASKIVIFSTRINYGLFGDLKYLTSSETSVHTQAEAAGVESRGLKTREKAIVSSNIQSSYDTWAANFPEYMDYIHTTESCLIVSFLSTALCLILLGVISLGLPASGQAKLDTLSAGFYALALSALCLFVGLLAWMGVPLSAFTTECHPSALPGVNGTGLKWADTSSDFYGGAMCVQLDGGLCSENCSTTSSVNRGGGMYGIAVFSCLLQCVCLVFWAKLQEELSSADDQSRGGRTSFGTITSEVTPVLS